MNIDLHTHSTASDGTDSPAQLLALAAQAGLSVVAITDHDTTGGWAEVERARPAGLTVVPGTEFSCVYRPASGRPIRLHLLGYLFDADDPALRAERDRLQADRLGRGRRIVDNLAAAGYPITWEQVSALADGGSVGRPHIARALVDQGVVRSVTEAFAQLLASSSPYYAEKQDTDVFTALDLIRGAGGVAVFAHPLARRRGAVVEDEVIAELAAAGLVGVEVDHPDHAEDDRRHLRGLAAELGLVPTGSSDYHGSNKTTSIGACLTDPLAYEQLFAGATAREPIA